jgi:hypothetical protein
MVYDGEASPPQSLRIRNLTFSRYPHLTNVIRELSALATLDDLSPLAPPTFDPRSPTFVSTTCPSSSRQYRNNQFCSGEPHSRTASSTTKLVKDHLPTPPRGTELRGTTPMPHVLHCTHFAGLSFSTRERTKSSCVIEYLRCYWARGQRPTRSAMVTKLRWTRSCCCTAAVLPANTIFGSCWTLMATDKMNTSTATEIRHGNAMTGSL